MEAARDDLPPTPPRRHLPWGVPLGLGVLAATLFWQVYGRLDLLRWDRVGDAWARSWHLTGSHVEGEAYSRAVALDPRIAAAWFNRAQVEERLGNAQSALNSYKTFLSLHPREFQSQQTFAKERVRALLKRG